MPESSSAVTGIPLQRVLVTGSAGHIGRVVCPVLRSRGHFVRGFDVRDSENVDDSMTGTLADMTAVARAVASMDAVVHLAAEPNECDFITRLLPSNFIGVYNVLEAARVHGVKRVVLASSIHAVFGIWDNKRLIRMEDGTSVKSHYGVSKVFAEQLGYMYNQRHGLSVIAVRIGWFTRNAAELRRCKERGWESMFFSHRDCADFFTRCVETPDVKYEVLMATSKHPLGGPGLDLEPARRVIGYEPQDEFGEGLTFDASGVTG